MLHGLGTSAAQVGMAPGRLSVATRAPDPPPSGPGATRRLGPASEWDRNPPWCALLHRNLVEQVDHLGQQIIEPAQSPPDLGLDVAGDHSVRSFPHSWVRKINCRSMTAGQGTCQPGVLRISAAGLYVFQWGTARTSDRSGWWGLRPGTASGGGAGRSGGHDGFPAGVEWMRLLRGANPEGLRLTSQGPGLGILDLPDGCDDSSRFRPEVPPAD